MTTHTLKTLKENKLKIIGSLKKLYKNNWRSDIAKNPKGTFETVSIHWIDLINYHFKIEKINKKYIKLFFNVLFIDWFFKKEIKYFLWL